MSSESSPKTTKTAIFDINLVAMRSCNHPGKSAGNRRKSERNQRIEQRGSKKVEKIMQKIMKNNGPFRVKIDRSFSISHTGKV